MKFTVVWRRTAVNELAELWLRAPDREAFSLAVAQIERLLANDPREQGESREDDTRVLLILPVGVEYDVDDGDRKVLVNTVWSIR